MSLKHDKNLFGNNDAGVAMLCAFNFITEYYEGNDEANQKALNFLIDVSS